jgi:hypothetical protein
MHFSLPLQSLSPSSVSQLKLMRHLWNDDLTLHHQSTQRKGRHELQYPKATATTMSMNNNSPDARNTFGLAGYRSSGVYSHLRVRTTITGDANIPHPNANKIFLRNLPGHCYTLPNVLLKFTLVEIIVLLPNWFKNKNIALRFMSNRLTANVHFVIFEEHHQCHFMDDYEREKAKKTITDEYLKAMRSHSQNRGWTKAKNTKPLGWDPKLIAMDGFVLDNTQLPQYNRLPSVPLRDLMRSFQKVLTQATSPFVCSL